MSALPPVVHAQIEELAGGIVSVDPVAGGCIANGSRVRTSTADLFVKWSAGEGGLTFEAEAVGLRTLRRADSPLVVPDVMLARNSEASAPGVLAMEWIANGAPGAGFDRRLGEGLAALHSNTEPGGRYGFASDNYIGRLAQRNGWADTWPEFFAKHRLAPQFEHARSQGRWLRRWDRQADRLLDSLSDLLPQYPPSSTLHGDLWSGNVLCSESGHPVLIDPAAYFGDGETDLAMMQLFGGFGREVFDTYAAAAETRFDGDFESRQLVYQLYHVVNHLNHFGGGYAAQVESILSRVA